MGQPRTAHDRLREDELTVFSAGFAGIVRFPKGATAHRPAPVIVVSPERYGLVQHTVDVAERFAAQGWAAISPDFYQGISEDEAGGLPQLSDETVLRHISAALDYMNGDDRCDGSTVVVFGVCRSGSWGLLAAARIPAVRGAILMYGGAAKREWALSNQRHEDYRTILEGSRAPILGVFGERDHTMSVDDVRRLRDELERAGRSYDFTMVPDMPHGWLNDTMPGRFRADAAERTWAQMSAFLGEVAEPQETASPQVSWKFRSVISSNYDFSTNTRQE